MPKVLRMEEPTEDPKPKSDQALHEALMADIANSRDREAFEALFRIFAPKVKGMMQGAGAGSEMAEDLMQEVMMTVWRKASLYAPGRGSVSTWIFTIARNARIDRLRRQPVQPYVDVETVSIACDQPDAEARVIGSQSDEKVRRALDQLPEEQKTVIELAFLNYMPQSEIAAHLKLPIGTVKSRTRLAYRKLKEQLEELK
jgi:RNA polymerase sigma-70 factor (ECF subfamily)